MSRKQGICVQFQFGLTTTEKHNSPMVQLLVQIYAMADHLLQDPATLLIVQARRQG